MRPLVNTLADLNASEAHCLAAFLRFGADESYAAYGRTDTVTELENTLGYVASVRRNTLSAVPCRPSHGTIRETEQAHEELFGELDAGERRAFAVHMQAAQSEARSAGTSGRALQELVCLMHATERAVR